ncbi:MAG: hypothetical protein A2Z59_07175 [Nitrospinae bacterium RIFCSPLOWO2_02_39_17]|nr:MAG: hypothetical protein A2Z59_07175 [Nitrospinae bacterium RIFCSPLOWO2_02_39_17]
MPSGCQTRQARSIVCPQRLNGNMQRGVAVKQKNGQERITNQNFQIMPGTIKPLRGKHIL